MKRIGIIAILVSISALFGVAHADDHGQVTEPALEGPAPQPHIPTYSRPVCRIEPPASTAE